MLLLVGTAVLIMLASLAGKLTVWRGVGAAVEKNLDFLVSISAGVFFVFAYQLAGESIEHAGSLAEGLMWVFGGAIGIWVLFSALPALHHHGPEHEGHSHLDPRRMLFSDALHNTGDGIFLAASFAVSPAFGVWAGVSVFLHELLQEVSEFFVLRDSGFSTQQALLWNFAVSSTVLLGAGGGFLLLEMFEVLEGPILGIAAGGIFVVVLHDLIPHSVRESITRAHYAKHLVCFALGCAIMVLISVLVPHVEVAHGGDEGGVANPAETL